MFELANSIGLILFSFLKEVTEEEIEKNIEYLERCEWFQKYLASTEYQQLIFANDDVRYCIGKFNVKRMHKVSYRNKWEGRIEKCLSKNKNGRFT